MYIAFILWPHLARLKADASRQSALLSHVPPEMDVRAHVKAVFRRSAQRRKGLLRFGGGKGGSGGGGSSAAPSSALILPTGA